MSCMLDLLQALEENVEELIKKHQALCLEKKQLEDELQQMREKLDKQVAIYKELKDKNLKLSTANSILGGDNENSRKVKNRLSFLIKEVDECIALVKHEFPYE